MLKYIELKTGFTGNGPAWIARVTVSRSGRTIYFNGMALKRAKGGMASGNHYELQSGSEYWISGVKKTGLDRHWAGSGKVAIEESAVAEYLEIVGGAALDASRFQVVPDLPPTDPGAFHAAENREP
jgi:hypothetical protein